jgi:hypothetical protein
MMWFVYMFASFAWKSFWHDEGDQKHWTLIGTVTANCVVIGYLGNLLVQHIFLTMANKTTIEWQGSRHSPVRNSSSSRETNNAHQSPSPKSCFPDHAFRIQHGPIQQHQRIFRKQSAALVATRWNGFSRRWSQIPQTFISMNVSESSCRVSSFWTNRPSLTILDVS